LIETIVKNVSSYQYVRFLLRYSSINSLENMTDKSASFCTSKVTSIIVNHPVYNMP